MAKRLVTDLTIELELIAMTLRQVERTITRMVQRLRDTDARETRPDPRLRRKKPAAR